MVKLSFRHTKNGVGEVWVMDRVQHLIRFYDKYIRARTIVHCPAEMIQDQKKLKLT